MITIEMWKILAFFMPFFKVLVIIDYIKIKIILTNLKYLNFHHKTIINKTGIQAHFMAAFMSLVQLIIAR